MDNLNLIFPEILISLSIMFLLIFGVFKKESSSIIHNLSAVVLFITAAIIFNKNLNVNTTLFNESYKIDYLASLMKIITLFSAILVLLIIFRAHPPVKTTG